MSALRLGTRGSVLARAQTALASAALAARDVGSSEVVITTGGDRDRQSSLLEIGGQGVFVQELESALAEGRLDVAVHSAKDVPTAVADGTVLAAYLPRADVRDVLISRGGATLVDLPAGATVGCSSRRRMAQIRLLRPDLQFADIRGNVDTRLLKLEAGGFDAILLAAAGLARLERLDVVTEYLSIERMLPAPGQGAIVLQARSDDAATLGILEDVNDDATSTAVRAERALLETLGAGCTLPVAALAHQNAASLTLLARVCDNAGERSITLQRSGEAAEPERLGHTLGEEMMTRGAADLLREVVA